MIKIVTEPLFDDLFAEQNIFTTTMSTNVQ